MATDSKQEWYSVNEVAKRLGVGWTRVNGWIHSGKLPAVDLNKDEAERKAAYRINAEEVQKFLDAREVEEKKPRKERVTKRQVPNHF